MKMTILTLTTLTILAQENFDEIGDFRELFAFQNKKEIKKPSLK